MAQTILFKFTAEDIGVAKAQDNVKDRLREINKEIKAAKQLGNPYDKLLAESVKLNRETADLRNQQKALNREFQATKVPTDSLAGLRLEYGRLIDKVKELSVAERQSPAGKALIKNAASVRSEISGIEASLGRFTNNVGNYKSALLGIGDSLTGGLATGGVAAGVTALIGLMKVGARVAIDYEKKLDDLSALTGVTGAGLAKLQDVEQGLRQIDLAGVEVVSTGSEILNALKLVGGARPELLQNADALGEVTKQAIVLSKAGGDTLQQSVTGLTTVLGQFNQGAADSERIINELAAGAKVGASEIPQTTDALREFGTVANINNATTAESVALIELLADRQLKGAEAGTQLRNILTKLASADVLPKKAQEAFKRLGIDINVLKDTTLPLQTRLEELAKANGDLAALSKAFGVENLQAATIITEGLPKYAALKAGIEGTNEAYIQAGIRADNASTAIDNLTNKVQNRLQKTFEQATPAIKSLTGFLGELVDTSLDFESLFVKAVAAPFGGLDSKRAPVNPNASAFDINNPLGGPQSDPFGVIRPLTQTEKDNMRQKAIELTKIRAEAEKEEEEKSKGTKKEVFAKGSLGALQQEYEKLQKQISNTPGDSPLLEGLIKKSVDAEQKIQSLKNIIEGIRNPTAEPTDEQRALELATGIDPEAALKEAKRLRDNLGAALGGGIGAPDQVDPTAELAAQRERELAEKQKANNEKRIEEEKRVNQALQDAAISSADTIANSVFQIRQNSLDKEFAAKSAALDAQEAKAIEAAQGNATKEAQIRKEFDAKRKALEKKAAQERKELARKEALVNIALSVTKALTGGVPPFNFILAGLATVAGLAQLAVINSQEFAGGGKVKRLGTGKITERQNAPRTAHGDTVLAYVKPGEMVLNEQQQRRIGDMAGHDIFSKAGVPGAGSGSVVPFFASGGVVDFVPQATFAAQSSAGSNIKANAEFTDEQVAIMGNRLASVIAATVAQELRGALAEGIGDANRRLEREAAAEEIRQG